MMVTRRGILAAGTVAATLPARKLRAQESGRLKVLSAPAKPPEVAFRTPDGAPRRLSDYRGQGLVVNLWATWCAPCVAELPSLAALAKTVAADNIAVLPISSDHGGAAAVKAFYKTHALTGLPVLLDPEGALMHAFAAPGIPATYVIDLAGVERGRAEGAMDWSMAAIVELVRRLTGTVHA
ncbi:MAG: TlpA family protein disulfide reductase [Pseudomonadota bacterium]|nr:TlpA family protein disulfide reductase [Pseudomonadota bacterium]